MAENTLTKIDEILNDAPLEEIFETAEIIASAFPIPGLPIIVKILGYCVKLRPAASAGLKLANNIAANSGEGASQNEDSPQNEIAEKNEILEQMIDIACEDGVIDDEEEKFLRAQAVEAGLNPDNFMFTVRAKLRDKNKEFLDQMVEVACEDGVIDDEEEKYLRTKAAAAGLNPDDFMFMVKSKLKK